MKPWIHFLVPEMSGMNARWREKDRVHPSGAVNRWFLLRAYVLKLLSARAWRNTPDLSRAVTADSRSRRCSMLTLGNNSATPQCALTLLSAFGRVSCGSVLLSCAAHRYITPGNATRMQWRVPSGTVKRPSRLSMLIRQAATVSLAARQRLVRRFAEQGMRCRLAV